VTSGKEPLAIKQNSLKAIMKVVKEIVEQLNLGERNSRILYNTISWIYVSIIFHYFFITPGQCTLITTFEHKLYIQHINICRKAKNKQTEYINNRCSFKNCNTEPSLPTTSYTLETLMTWSIPSLNKYDEKILKSKPFLRHTDNTYIPLL
jgi:hypothetical protein